MSSYWKYMVSVLILILILASCGKEEQPDVLRSPIESAGSQISPIASPALDKWDGEPRIMFLSDRDGVRRWYSMRSDGSDVKLWGFPDSLEIKSLNWIPGLEAFVVTLVTDEGGEDLFLIDPQGQIQHRLTMSPVGESSPIYSEAANRIAFVCVNSDLDICTIYPSAENLTYITNIPSRDASPAWSPSGERILFVSNRSGVPDVWIVNSDGTEPENLTATGQPHGAPSWSPDGTKILFTSQRDMNWEVYTMEADGKNPVNLTNNPARDMLPIWSPNGEHIAFRSDREGNDEIYVMNSNGKELVNITNSSESDEAVFVWTPDSKNLLYVSHLGSNADIYLVNRDGTGTQNLTDNPGNDTAPQWID